MTIRVVQPGFFTTIQDLGRYGYAHLGISAGGAADGLSLRIANRLVGNADNAPALEMTLLGATLEFEHGAIAALTGATCERSAGDASLPCNAAFEMHAGTVLHCGTMVDGARCYLAVQGGFEVPLALGSASTSIAGQFGGLHGAALKSGDVLHVRRTRQGAGAAHCSPAALRPMRAPAIACDPRSATGLVLAGNVRAILDQLIRCQRAIGPARLAAARARSAPAQYIRATHGRHCVGSDSGPAEWAADYPLRGSADHRRISEDRQRDCRRSASRGPVEAARCSAVRRSHDRRGSAITG